MAVATIICAYRSNFPHGDEAFAQIATRAIEDYPEPVLTALACPKSGIIATSKFPPAIAELREWCDAKAQEFRNAEMRTLFLANQGDKEALKKVEKHKLMLERFERIKERFSEGEPYCSLVDAVLAIRKGIAIPEAALRYLAEEEKWEFKWPGYSSEPMIDEVGAAYPQIYEMAAEVREKLAKEREAVMGPDFFAPLK